MALRSFQCYTKALLIFKKNQSNDETIASDKCQKYLEKIKEQYNLQDSFISIIKEIKIEFQFDGKNNDVELAIKVILDTANKMIDTLIR